MGVLLAIGTFAGADSAITYPAGYVPIAQLNAATYKQPENTCVVLDQGRKCSSYFDSHAGNFHPEPWDDIFYGVFGAYQAYCHVTGTEYDLSSGASLRKIQLESFVSGDWFGFGIEGEASEKLDEALAKIKECPAAQ